MVLLWLVITSILSTDSIIAAKTIRVLKSDLSPEDYNESNGAFLLDNRTVTLEDFSVCIRFNVKRLHKHEGVTSPNGNSAPILHFAPLTENRTAEIPPWFQFNAEFPVSYVAFGHPFASDSYHSWPIRRDSDSDITDIFETFEWNHICVSYKKINSFVKVAINGLMSNIDFSDRRVRNNAFPSSLLQNVYIGQCNYAKREVCSARGAEFADLNIWDRPLSDDEMTKFTSCTDTEMKGNVVEWAKAQFVLRNMTEVNENIEYVCEPRRPGDILITSLNTFPDHVATCNNLRSKVTLMDSEAKREELIKKRIDLRRRGIADVERHIWSGFWDVPVENDFASVHNQSLKLDPSFNPWRTGEPNGGRRENCGAELSVGGWIDWNCNGLAFGFCVLEKQPLLKFRGLCPQSQFDLKYRWTGDFIGGNYAFFGFRHTKLSYAKDRGQWELRVLNGGNNSIYAVTKGERIPFGTHKWKVFGDSCQSEPMVEIPLSFNSCNDHEFNCNDGACVEIERRCDGRIDYEVECQAFTTDSDYLKFMPPLGTAISLFPVHISVEVLNVLGISEVDNFIDLQLRIHLRWKDARLSLYNLKDDRDLNALTYEMRNEIWLPEIVFYNTDEKYESLNDIKSSAVIQRNGSFGVRPLSYLLNGNIFSGSENPIIFSRVYDFKYLCDFDMRHYPFDQQNCSAIFIMKGNVRKFVELVPDQLDYVGPEELAQYFVQASHIYSAEIMPNLHGVKVELVFARRLLSVFLTTYLPTILICIVSFTTNFFKGFFFEAIVTVNLTSMLLLVTLFISVSENLPKAAYLKNIEIWLIFVLFVPFSEVIVNTLIDNLRSGKDRDINHSMNTVTERDQNHIELEILPKKKNAVHAQGENNSRKKTSKENSSKSRVERVTYLYMKEQRRQKQLKMLLILSRFIMPVFVVFAAAYYIHGLRIYRYNTME